MRTQNNKIEKCLKEGQKGGPRHKGLIKTIPDENKAKLHLRKAVHNYEAMSYFYKGGYSDWSPIASFYCLYHCLLAILAKYGYESRNQSCTFALVESFIEQGKVTEITKEDLKTIYDPSAELESGQNILDIRETMSYGPRVSVKEAQFQEISAKTAKLLQKLRQEIET